MSYHYLFRIIILGHPSVGKTSLLRALNGDVHCPLYEPTIGIDFGSRLVHLPEQKVIKTHIWDTAGQEYFSPIVRTYYRDTAGAALVFDVTMKRSFERIQYWLNELKEVNENPGRLALVANKIDLARTRVISTEKARAFAEKNDMDYFEISVKKKDGVECFFYDFVQSIYRSIDPTNETCPAGIKKYTMDINTINTPKNPQRDKECCILL